MKSKCSVNFVGLITRFVNMGVAHGIRATFVRKRMSRLTANRANQPSERNPSKFKGFRKEWRTDTTAVKEYGATKRKRLREALEQMEEHKKEMQADVQAEISVV